MLRLRDPVDASPVSRADLIFAGWWYGAGIALALATWVTVRRGQAVDYEAALKVLLVGIAAALVLYMVPIGQGTVASPADTKLQLLASLAIAWTSAVLVLRPRRHDSGRSAVALAAFIGVNAPPLALLVSASMVCGGHPSCL
jgi:hypothetical protein